MTSAGDGKRRANQKFNGLDERDDWRELDVEVLIGLMLIVLIE